MQVVNFDMPNILMEVPEEDEDIILSVEEARKELRVVNDKDWESDADGLFNEAEFVAEKKEKSIGKVQYKELPNLAAEKEMPMMAVRKEKYNEYVDNFWGEEGYKMDMDSIVIEVLYFNDTLKSKG